MRFELNIGKPHAAQKRSDGKPFRILVLADLHGDAAKAPPPISERRIVRVDIDNIEDVQARYAPSVLIGDDSADRLQFSTLEDFHPDELVKNAALFHRLRDLRKRLEDPTTFADAAAELKGPNEAPQDETADNRSVFEMLLGEEPGKAAPAERQAQSGSSIERLIRGIVAPHIVAEKDPQLPQLLSAVDVSMSDAMRGLLHYPAFQAVEATWRAIHWLIASLELDENLELYLLHLTRDELTKGTGPNSGIYQRLVDQEARTEGGLQMSVLVGDYQFGASADDFVLLESMGSLAAAAGAPFVSGSKAGLLGTDSVAQQADSGEWQALDAEVEAAWNAFRSRREAKDVGLALPRFLLRLPYGKKSDSIERFEFEELPPSHRHESYLWGNAAFACAMVLARGFQSDGAPSNPDEVTGLPAYVFDRGEERHLKPCAEVCFNERAVEAVLARGIMPLVSFRDRDSVRLIRLQSVANPPTPLGGRDVTG